MVLIGTFEHKMIYARNKKLGYLKKIEEYANVQLPTFGDISKLLYQILL